MNNSNKYLVKKLRIILFILIVISFLSSCSSNNINKTSTSVIFASPTITLSNDSVPSLPPYENKKNWESEWLLGIPCAPPCFENIIPGKTSKDDAVSIMKRNTEISRLNINGEIEMVEWEWSDGRLGGLFNYSSHGSEKVVDLIQAFFTRPIEFKEIIESYGDPTHILASVTTDAHGDISYNTLVVYHDFGFALMPVESNKPVINQDMEFTHSLMLYEPTVEGFNRAFSSWRVDSFTELVPWEGFKDFDFYCVDRTNGEVC
jgi:hypothetical protein